MKSLPEIVRDNAVSRAPKEAKVYSFLPALQRVAHPAYASFGIGGPSCGGPFFTLKRTTATMLTLLGKTGIYDVLLECRRPAVQELLGCVDVNGETKAMVDVLRGIDIVRSDAYVAKAFASAQDYILLANVLTAEQAYNAIASFHEGAFHLIGSEMNPDHTCGVVKIDVLLKQMADRALIILKNRVSFYRDHGMERED